MGIARRRRSGKTHVRIDSTHPTSSSRGVFQFFGFPPFTSARPTPVPAHTHGDDPYHRIKFRSQSHARHHHQQRLTSSHTPRLTLTRSQLRNHLLLGWPERAPHTSRPHVAPPPVERNAPPWRLPTSPLPPRCRCLLSTIIPTTRD